MAEWAMVCMGLTQELTTACSSRKRGNLCVYATEADLITYSEAQLSDSDCIWTNSRQLHMDWDLKALSSDPPQISTTAQLSMITGNRRRTAVKFAGMR
jgi:hypothetical protein